MKVAYWTTACLEPRYEAVSKEVLKLSSEFPRSWVFAVNPNLWARMSLRGRYAGLNPSLTALLRVSIPLIEKAFDLNHVYGNLTPWAYHKSLRSRPIIHTVTQDSENPVLEFLDRCGAIVVQTDSTRERLLSLGVPREKLHLKHPGIDLRRFRPLTSHLEPSATPRVLFSTSPRTVEEMEARGVYLLLDAARMSPRARFRLLYRTWRSGYTSLEPTRLAVKERDLSNVELLDGVAEDMTAEYGRADFTVIPFTHHAGGKECPNSALESLSSGVPVLISSQCPFSRFVAENSCGLVFDPTPNALAEAIEEGCRRWRDFSVAARRAAEAYFDASCVPAFYRGLYEAQPARARRAAGVPTHL